MEQLDKAAVIARIKHDRAIAIIRTPSAEQALATAQAVIAGGFKMVEITFGVPDATGVIAELVKQNAPEILFGAGTVLTRAHVNEAVDAGAQFLVSPCVLPEVIEAARERQVTNLPGAFTPTEIYQAYSLGGDIIKLFPAVQSGPQYLKAIRGPLPDIPIVPTAGVTTANVAEWFGAGAIAVGAAGAVLDATAIAKGNWNAVRELARQFMTAVLRAP
ncbi:MAG: bifunctional 4-hydroxy-2-oxoglutarate aldolase/2-dehydro-3-deoxy-phosphogluconate aldolase [Verrucomicrobiota bacterium]|nr:bifunctional 4-hydroxy-2-oxoglutarate aldolase/2-dehydro-3-deoxy-phosphogluconate aldolase [Verrucomicrobiota bacterium]